LLLSFPFLFLFLFVSSSFLILFFFFFSSTFQKLCDTNATNSKKKIGFVEEKEEEDIPSLPPSKPPTAALEDDGTDGHLFPTTTTMVLRVRETICPF
jgi:hypothetical protein